MDKIRFQDDIRINNRGSEDKEKKKTQKTHITNALFFGRRKKTVPDVGLWPSLSHFRATSPQFGTQSCTDGCRLSIAAACHEPGGTEGRTAQEVQS